MDLIGNYGHLRMAVLGGRRGRELQPGLCTKT